MISKYSSILYDAYEDALPEGSEALSIDGVQTMVNSVSLQFCNEPCSPRDFNLYLQSLDMNSPVNRQALTSFPFSKITETSHILYEIMVYPVLKRIAIFLLDNYDKFDKDSNKYLDYTEFSQ